MSPGNALVVSSAMDVKERRAVQDFLGAAVDRYGGRVTDDAVGGGGLGEEGGSRQETFDDYGGGRQQQQQAGLSRL